MPSRRGDNIPSVRDYSHWNEEAEAMWYAENQYDMMHADEILDDYDDRDCDYPEIEDDHPDGYPHSEYFDVEDGE